MPKQERSGLAWATSIAAMGVLTAALLPVEASAQSSGQTVKIVYAFAAGGGGDGFGRLIADRLGKRIDATVVLENKGGASGRIGTKSVVTAAPDGNTLLFSPMAPIVLHPIVYSNFDYDPLTDLAPISQLATFDLALIVSNAIPAKSVTELVAWIKANPDKANYGTPGLGGLPHFFVVMFGESAGVKLRNVPYRGSGPVLNDIVSGQLPIASMPTADALGLLNAGTARTIATSGRSRSSAVPTVPTFKEAGLDIEGEGWYALYAPAKTPKAIVDRLSSAAQAILREPEMQARVQALGLKPTGTTSEELASLQKADVARWAPAVKASGFKPTN